MQRGKGEGVRKWEGSVKGGEGDRKVGSEKVDRRGGERNVM